MKGPVTEIRTQSHEQIFRIFDRDIFAHRYEYTHTEDRMWRKNRAKTPSLLNILGSCRGVDLNRFFIKNLPLRNERQQHYCLRNFGYKWGEGFDLLDPAGFIHQDMFQRVTSAMFLSGKKTKWQMNGGQILPKKAQNFNMMQF